MKKILLSSLPVITAVLILFILTVGVSALDRIQAQIDKTTTTIFFNKNTNILPTANNGYDNSNEHEYQYNSKKRLMPHS